MEAVRRERLVVERVLEVIWAVGLICLPISSFPLFASITSGLVAPLSIIPFFILLLLWVLPFIFRKGSLPKETIPLIMFSMVVLISCAAAYFFFIPGFKGKTVTGQEIRSLFTLIVGLTFFLVTATWVKDTVRLRNTWKYITIGGMISLAWSAVQAFYIFKHYNFFPYWVEQVQSWLVIHPPSFYPYSGRISGMTYEASWFAHQMVIVYLPIWLAATYYKTSAFKLRLWRLSLENILLVIGLAAFFLSSPRISLVSLLLIAMYVFVKLNIALQRVIARRLSSSKLLQRNGQPTHHKTLVGLLISLGIFCIYFLVLGGVVLFAIQRDWRLETLVSNPPTAQEIVGVVTLDQNTLLSLSNRFIFLERMVYWLNGWNVFNQHPWLGVGLGNAGFFFPQLAPAMGWSSPEIRNVLYYFTQLPNVKSLWFRLLAETGLVGFSVFIAWMFSLYQSSRASQYHPDAIVKTLAFAGQLALLAFIGEGLSIDSFAMPYFWVMAGIVAGAGLLFRQQIRNSDRSS